MKAVTVRRPAPRGRKLIHPRRSVRPRDLPLRFFPPPRLRRVPSDRLAAAALALLHRMRQTILRDPQSRVANRRQPTAYLLVTFKSLTDHSSENSSRLLRSKVPSKLPASILLFVRKRVSLADPTSVPFSILCTREIITRKTAAVSITRR